jgi:L-lactate permease
METKIPLEERKKIVKSLMRVGKTIVLVYMVSGAIMVVFLTSHYHRMDALMVALVGTLGVVVSGGILAYYLGNELGKIYGRMIK